MCVTKSLKTSFCLKPHAQKPHHFYNCMSMFLLACFGLAQVKPNLILIPYFFRKSRPHNLCKETRFFREEAQALLNIKSVPLTSYPQCQFLLFKYHCLWSTSVPQMWAMNCPNSSHNSGISYSNISGPHWWAATIYIPNLGKFGDPPDTLNYKNCSMHLIHFWNGFSSYLILNHIQYKFVWKKALTKKDCQVNV